MRGEKNPSHEDKLDLGRNQGLAEEKSIEEGLKVMRATKRSLSRISYRSFDTLFPGGIDEGAPADEPPQV